MNLSLYNGKHNPLYSDYVSTKDNDKNIDKLEHAKVYATEKWKRMRLVALSESPLCIICSSIGRTIEATTVDHCITFVDISDPIAFNSDNLFCLCHSCHANLYYIESLNRDYWKSSYNKGVLSIKDIAKIKYKPVTSVTSDGYYKISK